MFADRHVYDGENFEFVDSSILSKNLTMLSTNAQLYYHDIIMTLHVLMEVI